MWTKNSARWPLSSRKRPRIAIAHHWFVTWGGGEKVVENLAEIFPSADIFTLLSDRRILPSRLLNHRISESFLQKIPGARKFHRHLLPLYPIATKRLDLTDYDLVISSDSGPIKGVKTSPGSIHICYCHSPMRYLWDQYNSYASAMKGVTRPLFEQVAPRVREWDFLAAQKVTHFLANSRFVAQRIHQYYRRESKVVYPGIDTSRGWISGEIGDSYLFVGRLVEYKRVDLLIEACNRSGRKLRIVGTGPEEKRLRSMAGNTITFLGYLDTPSLWREYARCKAFLFAAEEDCGIAPLEAQSCGRPVIAYGKGGSLETVAAWEEGASPSQKDVSGIFFYQQTATAIESAIRTFEKIENIFSPEVIQLRARSFDTSHFVAKIHEFLYTVAPHIMEFGA